MSREQQYGETNRQGLQNTPQPNSQTKNEIADPTLQQNTFSFISEPQQNGQNQHPQQHNIPPSVPREAYQDPVNVLNIHDPNKPLPKAISMSNMNEVHGIPNAQWAQQQKQKQFQRNRRQGSHHKQQQKGRPVKSSPQFDPTNTNIYNNDTNEINSQTPNYSYPIVPNSQYGSRSNTVQNPVGDNIANSEFIKTPHSVNVTNSLNYDIQASVDQQKNQSDKQQPQNVNIPQSSAAFQTPHVDTIAQPPMMPYPMRKYIADMTKYKLYKMVETLNVPLNKILDENYWNSIIDENFTPTSTVTISKSSHVAQRHFVYLTKMFPAICQAARYLNIAKFEAYPHQVFTQVLSNGTIFFSCLRFAFTYHYQDGSYVAHYSQFKGVFNSSLLIEWMDFSIHSFVPGIEWNTIENTMGNPEASKEILEKLQTSSTVKQSPNYNGIPDKNSDTSPHSHNISGNDDNQGTVSQKFAAITQLRSNFDIFRNISNIGVHNDVVRLLQINEIISDLRDIRVHQKKYNISSPLEGLQSLIQTNKMAMINQQQDINVPKNRTTTPSSSGNIINSATVNNNAYANMRPNDVNIQAYDPQYFNDNEITKKRTSSTAFSQTSLNSQPYNKPRQ